MRLLILILAIILDQVGLGHIIDIKDNIDNKNENINTDISYVGNISPNFYEVKDLSVPDVSSKSHVVLDNNSNNVLTGRSSDIKAPMASLTKIMTAIIVLESSDLSDNLVVSKNAVAAYGEGIDLRYDENLTVEDTLYAALLSSSNDACVALAEKISDTEEQFVDLMNKKSEEIGLTKTHFTNVSGIDDVDHFSNVLDLAKLARYALLNNTFRNIVSTKEKVITSKEGITHYLRNTNKLLGSIEGVSGVKTGLTGEAGECLIALVERDGSSLLIVLLGSDNRFKDTNNLINWVYENYSWK